jgi:hypothetical protein
MWDKSQSNNEAFEAVDFIVNVLKEHEKDLDRLVSELSIVSDQLGAAGELNSKVGKIEGRISSLQNEVSDLVKCLSASTSQDQIKKASKAKMDVAKNEPASAQATAGDRKDFLIATNLNQLEDFFVLAAQAQTVSFNFKETEHIFEASAIRNKQLFTYKGELPKLAYVLKSWLSSKLSVSEENVLEGTLALG